MWIRGKEKNRSIPAGANAQTLGERRYRVLTHALREVPFGYRDFVGTYGEYGFAEVFEEFDPSIINAGIGEGVVSVMLFPPNRTHKIQVPKIGPMVSRHREEEGKVPSVVMVSRDGEYRDIEVQGKKGKKSAFVVFSGEFYVTPEQYAEALVLNRGLSKKEAKLEAARVAAKYSGKGIRVLAHSFGREGTKKDVIGVPTAPLPGHPRHESGELEEGIDGEGQQYPAHMASQYTTLTKFDKMLYKEMFRHFEKVNLPEEIGLRRYMIQELAKS